MKTFWVATKLFIWLTFLTGVIYPLITTAIGLTVFSTQAHGSLVTLSSGGAPIGSSLLAQPFKTAKYFWPRPSAVDYNGMATGGSNLGPTSIVLAQQVKDRTAQGFVKEMLFASGSGLDPEISPSSAYAQLTRVASARGVSEETIRLVIEKIEEGRQLGFLGEPRVNVLQLNLALDSMSK